MIQTSEKILFKSFVFLFWLGNLDFECDFVASIACVSNSNYSVSNFHLSNFNCRFRFRIHKNIYHHFDSAFIKISSEDWRSITFWIYYLWWWITSKSTRHSWICHCTNFTHTSPHFTTSLASSLVWMTTNCSEPLPCFVWETNCFYGDNFEFVHWWHVRTCGVQVRTKLIFKMIHKPF